MKFHTLQSANSFYYGNYNISTGYNVGDIYKLATFKLWLNQPIQQMWLDLRKPSFHAQL